MITIHNEVTISLSDPQQQDMTLWLVSYGTPAHAKMLADWHGVIEVLRRYCAQRGWLLETGDDPYQEKSLAVFDGGFSWPPDDDESHDDVLDQARRSVN